MGRHEVDSIRRRHLCGNDQIAFILPVFVVDEDIHAAITRFFDDFLNRNQRRRVVVRKEIAFQLAKRISRRIPVRLIKVAKGVCMKPGCTSEARA